MAGIGVSVVRREDGFLLRGQGTFIDDVNCNHQLHAWFLRSALAHAHLDGIDVSTALDVPGVVAVFVGADLIEEPAGMLQGSSALTGRDGEPMHIPPWPAMAQDTARYVGDTVAMVVAETREAAREASELIDVNYRELPAVVELAEAHGGHAPLIWDRCADNVALDWERGDREATHQCFESAAHVVEVDLLQNRIVVAAMETRGVLASYDANTERFDVCTPTQGVDMVREPLARSLGVGVDQVRVTTPDVGGAFGIKASLYPEQTLCALAAKNLGRPIKWFGERGDSFISDYHARDHLMHGELALDEHGRFLAVRADVVSNMGAYLHGPAPIISTNGGTRLLCNVYRLPTFYAQTRCVFTNTIPIGAYRGAGKPEFAHLVELLVDAAAREIGMPPATLRRLNMITPEELPYSTPQGLVYDSGDFELAMDLALKHADWRHVEERRADAMMRGKRLGLGFAVYIEPDGFMDNRVTMTLQASGRVQVTTTAQTGGQGYETVFAQIAESLLGLPMEDVDVVQGDSDAVGKGKGTGGSRGTTVTGTAMVSCAEQIRAKATRIAAHLLQADTADLEFSEGTFTLGGGDRRISLVAVAASAHDPSQLPDGVEPGLSAEKQFEADAYCYPSGCHVCEVEVDVETGATDIVRYVQLSDFGTVINPMLLEGQIHGGVAQGIGQVLLEGAVYERDTGQRRTGSFMDYCLPRAAQLPAFECERLETVCTTNPLGVKGCGECGTTGSLPAVMNAVRDALADLDVTALSMPITAEKVWRVLDSGR